MTGLVFTRMSVVALMIAALAACSSGAPPTVRPGSTDAPPTTGPATPAGGPSTAEGLCGAIAADLALAALGAPLDEPNGGDVVPRPNGIYCRYSLAGDANTNVEAQLREATRADFESLAETMGTDIPLAGVGEAGFRRDTSSLGGGGVTVVAFADGKLATVVVNREGADQALVNAAAEAIAKVVLLATP